MRASKRILVYLAILPFSFLLFALGWFFIAPSCLYHCWDDAPPFVISWYPPFIHPSAASTDGKPRDYYLAPEWLVYLVWVLFIVGVFVAPALVVWRVARKGDAHETA
jgi:hypothetical protein